jgi:hypothetical protein
LAVDEPEMYTCLYLSVNMFGKYFNVLFDGGSPVSLMSKEIYESSGNKLNDLAPCAIRLYGAGGATIKHYGVTVIECKIGELKLKQKFIIADVNPEIILGLDFQRKNECSVHASYRGDTLVMYGMELSLRSERRDCTNVVIPCYISTEGDNDVVAGVPLHLRSMFMRAIVGLTDAQASQVKTLIIKYSDVFEGPNGELGRTNKVCHVIDTGSHPPIKLPPRRLPEMQREILDKELDKMIASGVIEPSESPWAAHCNGEEERCQLLAYLFRL